MRERERQRERERERDRDREREREKIIFINMRKVFCLGNYHRDGEMEMDTHTENRNASRDHVQLKRNVSLVGGVSFVVGTSIGKPLPCLNLSMKVGSETTLNITCYFRISHPLGRNFLPLINFKL